MPSTHLRHDADHEWSEWKPWPGVERYSWKKFPGSDLRVLGWDTTRHCIIEECRAKRMKWVEYD
jgi:hypothetical protein